MKNNYLNWKMMLLLLLGVCLAQVSFSQKISGEQKRWHKISVTFDGPNTSETANPNPFSDFRLEVTFTHSASNRSYTVPGYFAACGNADDNSCSSGNQWRAHFVPDDIGTWTWSASFKKGANVAINGGGSGGGFMDGTKGSFAVAESDKSGRDFRSKNLGKLKYVGQHYLRHTGTNPTSPNGPWFLKAGADSPENALNYVDFDATPNFKNRLNKIGNKSWQPHQRDYVASDASAYTWDGGKGTEILGMINYLSGQGANVVSFLTWNTGGDGGAVFPHILKGSIRDYEADGGNRNKQWGKMHKDRFDVSKLAQWENMMSYADKKGVYLHFKTMETENDNFMDGNKFGRERKLYYRELIARFGHHLALNWNITEETTLPDNVVRSTAEYIKAVDPYDNHIVIHTYPGEQDQRYNPLLGNKSVLTGASIQTGKSKVHNDVKRWLEKSRNAGKRWVVANDEQGSASEGVRVSDKQIRDDVLWGTLLAGGAGVEYYSGYTNDDGDINGNDQRKRGNKYKEGGYALNFVNSYLQPFLIDMVSSDGVTSDGNDYVFAKAGEVYAIYRPNGGSTGLSLPSGNGKYDVQWYNPRNGGNLSAKSKLGNNLVAPDRNDWVALITRSEGNSGGGGDGGGCANAVTMNAIDFGTISVSGFSPAYKDPARNALAIDAAKFKDKFAAAKSTFNGKNGNYDIKITSLLETDGESTYRLKVGGKLIGQFKNVPTSTDYTKYDYTFKGVDVNNGDAIQVEFSSHSNGKIPEKDAFAFSRGRWTAISFDCTDGGGSNPSPATCNDGIKNGTETGVDCGGSCKPCNNGGGGGSNCDFADNNGLLIMEAESTKSGLGKWIVEKNVGGYTGDSHIEFTGNGSNGGPATSPLKYTFKINKGGNYRLTIRSHKQLDGQPGDKNNDGYVRVEGNYTAGTGGNPAALVDLKKDTKIFGGSPSGWAWATKLDVNNKIKKDPIYNFKAGETYTLVLSGRSIKWNVDRIVFYHQDVNANSARDASKAETRGNCSGGGGNELPVINITSPSNNSNFKTGASITITASASDKDGSIASVSFYNGSQKLGEDNTAPYSYTLNNAKVGNYSFAAIATDNKGASITSSSVKVTVDGNNGGGGGNGDGSTVTLSPIHDAYIQKATGFNNELIRIEGGNRVAYLMFDLSKVEGTITSAALKMTVSSDAGSGNIKVEKGASNSWTETTLSMANKPNATSMMGSLDGTYSSNNTYTWALSEGSINTGGRLSLVLTQTSGNDVAFASKEAKDLKAPQLVLTVKANQSKAPVGKVIWLRSRQNNNYVSSRVNESGAPLKANVSWRRGWERFRVVAADNGKVALQAMQNGKFTQAQLNKDVKEAPLKAFAESRKGWESYEWISLDDGGIALKAYNGKYIQARVSETGAPLKAMGNVIGPWEIFDFGIIQESTSSRQELGDGFQSVDVAVYPNPVLGSAFNISIDLKKSQDLNVKIFDNTGRVVYTEGFVALTEGKQSLTIDMERNGTIRSGVYFLSVESDEVQEVIKLMIK